MSEAESNLTHNPYPAQYAIYLVNTLKVAAEEASKYCQVSFASQVSAANAQLLEFSKSSMAADEGIWVSQLCQKLKRLPGSPEDVACANRSLNMSFTAWLAQKVVGNGK